MNGEEYAREQVSKYPQLAEVPNILLHLALAFATGARVGLDEARAALSTPESLKRLQELKDAQEK